MISETNLTISHGLKANNSSYYNRTVVLVLEGSKSCLTSWLAYHNFSKKHLGLREERDDSRKKKKKAWRGLKKVNLFSWSYIVHNGRRRNVGIPLLKRFIINRTKSAEEWRRFGGKRDGNLQNNTAIEIQRDNFANKTCEPMHSVVFSFYALKDSYLQLFCNPKRWVLLHEKEKKIELIISSKLEEQIYSHTSKNIKKTKIH